MSNEVKKILFYLGLIIGILVLGYFLYKIISLSREVDEKNTRMYKLDSLHHIDSTTSSQLVEDLKTEKQIKQAAQEQNKKLFDEIDQSKETIKILSQTVIQLQSKHVSGSYTDTIYNIQYVSDTSGNYLKVPIGGDTVKFFLDYGKLLSIDGKTWLYPNKNYEVNVNGKQITLDIIFTEDNNGVYTGYIDTNDPILSTIKFTTKINRDPTSSQSFWSKFGLTTGIALTTRNSFLHLGPSFSGYGIEGILGFDYSNLSISKSNVFYGIGFFKNW